MKKNIFFDWLTTLELREYRGLRKFSKTLNKNQLLFVDKLSRRFEAWKLNNKTIPIKQLSIWITDIKKKEGKKYLQTNFYKGIDNLKPFLHEFLIKKEVESNEILKQKIIFLAAKKRNFPNGYFYHLKNWEIENDNQNRQSFSYFYNRFQINYHRFFRPEFEKDKNSIELNHVKYQAKNVLENTWIDLQKFSLTTQIRLACELLSRQLIYNEKFKYFDNEKTNRLAEDILLFSFNELIAAHLYLELFNWLKLNELDNVNEFKKFKEKIFGYYSIFPKEEQVSILILLLNYTAHLIIKKGKVGIDLYYEIIDYSLKNKIIGNDEAIESNLFLNIYDITIQANNKFAIAFLQNYSDKLLDEERIWVLKFIESAQFYREKKFIKCLELINQLHSNNNYGLFMRKAILSLQCRIELQLGVKEKIITPTPLIDDNSNKIVILKNIELYNKSIQESQYFDIPSEEMKLPILNFMEIISIILNQTLTVSEIKKKINDKPLFSKTWLFSVLERYYEKV